MKYYFAVAGMFLLGIFGLVFIVMFETITIKNESEYYELKEAMEASMLESVDLACVRNVMACNGSIKISEQKFVENFTRRFSESVGGGVSGYTLEFYDIIESPPKATIKVTGTTVDYKLFEDGEGSGTFKILNNLTGIIESNHS